MYCWPITLAVFFIRISCRLHSYSFLIPISVWIVSAYRSQRSRVAGGDPNDANVSLVAVHHCILHPFTGGISLEGVLFWKQLWERTVLTSHGSSTTTLPRADIVA